MKIIAQKTNNLTTTDFIKNSLEKDFIDAMSLSVTYTKDNKIVVYNAPTSGSVITNTINISTLGELQGYEIVLLETMLKELNNAQKTKALYINLAPYNPGILSDENIEAVSKRMNEYVEELKRVIELYPKITVYIHSINRSLIAILKEKLPKNKLGFAVTGADITFVDVDYYVFLATTQNDLIIDTLLKNHKEVIIYVYSDYFVSYLYNHYLGEKSTPYLQETFEKLYFMGNYPEIIYKVFKT